jgi:two-component system, NarL family, nitrate/nitrite response regulator NarL
MATLEVTEAGRAIRGSAEALAGPATETPAGAATGPQMAMVAGTAMGIERVGRAGYALNSDMGASPVEARPRRIAFVDDHPTLLRGIVALFSDDPQFEIVGTGVTADDAVALAETTSPEILFLDLSMPGDAFAAISAITGRMVGIRIVIFTAFANIDLALKALDAGAHAYVLKGRPSEDLFAAIAAVSAGELFVSPDFSSKLMTGFRNRSRRERELKSSKLSAREIQIVEFLLEARSNKEIARALNLSEKTIKHYMTNLMNKLKVKSRLEVVLAAQTLRGQWTDTHLQQDQA